MVSLTLLVWPILLSALLVFVASNIMHMVLPHHKSDYRKVPSEDRVMDAMRPFNIPPGDYMLPRAGSMADMRSPEFKEKIRNGPVAIMTVLSNGQFGIGAQLIQWFLYCIVVSVFAAYIASRALPAGAEYLEVSRFASTVAFAGFALALWQNTIWYKRAWTTTLKSNLDSLVYAFIVGGTLGWLWPR